MYDRRKSDVPIVSGKSSNKEGQGNVRDYGGSYTGTKVETPDTAKDLPTVSGDLRPTAERVERRGSTKGNSGQATRFRTQCRGDLQHRLDRVRAVAERDGDGKFTTLWHHVYDVARLREAYLGLARKSAPGVDNVTWASYGEDLEDNLKDLSVRLQRGGYRAQPVLRVYIPKSDGRRRPLGVPALEDKIVQRATVRVLNSIYESEFLGFSYGFRPGRGAHNALDAVQVAIQSRKVSWVLDADIRGFFDAIDHDCLMRFVGHRIADERVLRHVKKWLNAGVLEDGELRRMKAGTPQGGSVSPLLANIYLHYVLDLWIQQWRKREARGEVIIVRYADDFLAGFQYRSDADRFLRALMERLHKFGLELHPDKTRLLEFDRFADRERAQRGVGKPDTFDFLGFTHYCGRTRNGGYSVKRHTMVRRMRSKLVTLKAELRRRMHRPIYMTGLWLKSVLLGYYQYYGVPGNYAPMASFRRSLCRLWRRVLARRSQRSCVTWGRVSALSDQWLPLPRIVHPHPARRLRVVT